MDQVTRTALGCHPGAAGPASETAVSLPATRGLPACTRLCGNRLTRAGKSSQAEPCGHGVPTPRAAPDSAWCQHSPWERKRRGNGGGTQVGLRNGASAASVPASQGPLHSYSGHICLSGATFYLEANTARVLQVSPQPPTGVVLPIMKKRKKE